MATTLRITSRYRAAAALIAAEEETEGCPMLKLPGNDGSPPDGGLITGPLINGGPITFPCAAWAGNACELVSALLIF